MQIIRDSMLGFSDIDRVRAMRPELQRQKQIRAIRDTRLARNAESKAARISKKEMLMQQAYDDNQSTYEKDYQNLMSLEYPTLTPEQLSNLPLDVRNYISMDNKHRNGNINVMVDNLKRDGISVPDFISESYKPQKVNTPQPYQTTQYNSVDDAKLNRMNQYRDNKSQDEIEADNAMYGDLPYSQSVANNAATYDTADQAKMKRMLAERAAKPPGVDEPMYAESTYETGVKDGSISKEGVTGAEDAWYPTKGNAERNMKVRANYDNSNVRNSNMYQNPYEGNDLVRAQKYDNAQGKLGIQSAKGYDMVQDVDRMREITGIAKTKNRMPDSFYGMSPEQAEDAIQRYGYPSKDNPYKFDYASGNSKWEIDEARRMGTKRIAKSQPQAQVSPRPQVQISPRPQVQVSPRPISQPRPEPMRTDTNLLNEGWAQHGASWDGSKPNQIGGRLPYQDNRPAPIPAKVVPSVSQANKDYYDGIGMFNDGGNRVR